MCWDLYLELVDSVGEVLAITQELPPLHNLRSSCNNTALVLSVTVHWPYIYLFTFGLNKSNFCVLSCNCNVKNKSKPKLFFFVNNDHVMRGHREIANHYSVFIHILHKFQPLGKWSLLIWAVSLQCILICIFYEYLNSTEQVNIICPKHITLVLRVLEMQLKILSRFLTILWHGDP